ncbi:hypothetical protein SAMN04488009_2830 [Maribacter sedimenticola]|uniref:DUF4352 domain-containing protein n=1 Tax=Maribacter sedimenticola TaxID=228956 RepID=A0ABY1SJ58_9FLAO|nr:hypothetical protein [Maribacter sedimenticola]SNR62829.1 hypothetical protein SAMN04488009_2830 [Maribacter sedimenticola]
MKVNRQIFFFKRVLLSFFVVLLLSSCNQNVFDSKKELLAHLQDPDNGYVQKKEINGLNFTLTYRPTDMLVQQVINERTTQKELDSVRSKYGKYMYLNISISNNGKEVLNSVINRKSDFGGMVNELAFGMGQKVHLISQSRDTLELLDYIYPREYGMGKATNMMFVYPRNDEFLKNDYFHLTIEDIGLKTGEVGFKIPTNLLIHEPKLNL